MFKFYTGVGSRETPPAVCATMKQIATWLEEEGYVLRSGGAEGADTAFESGVVRPENKKIFLPWKGFNGSTSPFYVDNPTIPPTLIDKAISLAVDHHPNWSALRQGGQKLMIRNSLQIIGNGDPQYLTQFVLCWTRDGKDTGGTGQALRLAHAYDVPIINLAHFALDAFDTKEKLLAFINSPQLRDIRGFYGKYAFLSNFYNLEVPLHCGGWDYHSSEAVYQAAKADYWHDGALAIYDRGAYLQHIRDIDSGNVKGENVKTYARQYNNALSEEWFDVNTAVMESIVQSKFAYDKKLYERLVATGERRIIESNTWKDTYWGVYQGTGKNVLGKILEGIRRTPYEELLDRFWPESGLE